MQEIPALDESHLDTIIQRLRTLQKELEYSLPVEATLAIYEEMFSLISKGETHLKCVEQQCFQLQLDSNGRVSKDTSGNPIKYPFILGENI